MLKKKQPINFVINEQRADKFSEYYQIQSKGGKVSAEINIDHGPYNDMVSVNYENKDDPTAFRVVYKCDRKAGEGKNVIPPAMCISSIYAENNETGELYGWLLSPLNAKLDKDKIEQSSVLPISLQRYFNSKSMCEFWEMVEVVTEPLKTLDDQAKTMGITVDNWGINTFVKDVREKQKKGWALDV